MHDCMCVCHTGWPTPEHPYGTCCANMGAVYPRVVLVTMYDEADLPVDPLALEQPFSQPSSPVSQLPQAGPVE